MGKSRMTIIALLVLSLSLGNASLVRGLETPSGVPFHELESFIDDYVEDHVGVTTPGAAVVLVKDGSIIFSKGYGFQDRESQIAVDSQRTVFEYGSVSKVFVYAAVMGLVEEGSIGLNTDIREVLPPGFLKHLKYDAPITPLHLMHHNAGFEDYLFDIILPSAENLPTLEEALRTFQPMQVHAPGAVTGYSNYGVALAAFLVQQLRGQEFHAYLMESVFQPLGMAATSAHPTLSDRPELVESKAMGYHPGRDGGFHPGFWSHIPLYPVGSVNGTAEDLARFAMAFLPEDGTGSPLFREGETLENMLSGSHEMGPGLPGFAHGFIEMEGEYRTLGHGGNTASFSAQMTIVPEERFGVIVLTNAASEMAVSLGLTEALLGERTRQVDIGSGPQPEAELVEGTYISARRMHRGFLELYGYLSLLHVRALGPDRIELTMGGQRGTFLQTRPYVYQRVAAEGAIFEHHFQNVYFEVVDGTVTRVSGDFLPLPPGRALPRLFLSVAVAVLSGLYFLFAPLVLLAGMVRRRRPGAEGLRRGHATGGGFRLLVLSGTALLLNNGALVVRMLRNNYRSFAEVRWHIVLNVPLAVCAAVAILAAGWHWYKGRYSKGQKARVFITMLLLLALLATLFDWQFFTLLP